MNDLISRQDALNALGEEPKAEAIGSYKGAFEWGEKLQWIKDRQAIMNAPSAQPDLITKIQNGIKVTDADDEYSRGMRNGMRWCKSLIDDKEPLYENCQSAQPGSKKGKWIYGKDEYGIGGYYCDKCGFFVPLGLNVNKFMNFIEDYNYCPSCGANTRGE